MQQRIMLLLTLMGALLVGLNAQESRGVCGNTHLDQLAQMERYEANLKIAKSGIARSRGATTYIPIQFHIVTRNNGTGGILFTDVLNQLCHLNNQYGEFDVAFYMPENPKILNNDVVYDDHTLSSGLFKMRQVRNRNALNVWIVNNATPGSGGPPIGQTLGYYDSPNDWIVIRKNQISAVNNTLAHEVGHFFSLFHPHFGWDADPYDANKHGLQVSKKAPNGGDAELMDRSNCETAGDKICDTAPDYNFALTWNGCTFNVDVKDPNGEVVDPDETLIMSYFNDDCTSKFTETQVDMMLADIGSSSRNFLTSNNYSPLAEEITDAPSLISPVESSVTSSFNKVELRWNGVTGADNYLVEVDRSSGFNIDKLQFIANQTSIVLEDILDADKNYRWRVTPFNASATCAGTSEVARFRTGLTSSVASINEVDNWTIQPNPVQEGTAISINVQATTAFEADLKLYNYTGQILENQSNIKFSTGNTRLPLTVGQLPKGVYIIALENERGVLNKKLVIQ